ncbi:MAG: ribbon-helix-helix protein, CopG family [Candidatus Aminicenantes bacterium]|nr:ribbon-helix-helix protein, CopG family [Candidatus Aminicenantes bacterium]
MSVQMLIRIESEVKDALTKLARKEGKSAGKLVREIVKDYIKDRDLGAYIDDLWDRMGGKLKAKGVKQEDIAAAIKKTRKNKHESSH